MNLSSVPFSKYLCLQIRTSSGQEVTLPALVFLVPAPDGEAIRTAQR